MRFALSRMDWQGQAIALALSIIAITASAKEKHSILVVAEPTAATFDTGEDVAVKLTITNNGHGAITFETCPTFYSVELKDSHEIPASKRVPEQPVLKDGELQPPDVLVCASSILVTLGPGKSWSTVVSLSEYFNLKVPGLYTGRVVFLPDVPSKSFRLTIRSKQKG